MTAENTTGDRGEERTESNEYPPMQDAGDIDVALALEQEKQDTKTAVNDVCEALLNDDVPLTGEKVGRLWEAAERLTGLSETLCQRVPPEYQIEER